MTGADWIAAGVGVLSLLGTMAGMVFSHGRSSERIAQLDGRLKEHAARIDSVERASEGARSAVDLLAQKIESLGERWTAEQKVAAVELSRVADSIRSGNELINARLDGMEKFSRAELEQVKHDVRNVKTVLTEMGRARDRQTA
jgi:hypothetical protein